MPLHGLVGILAAATATPPSLLLLGDSRDRHVYHTAVTNFCADDPLSLAWTYPAPPNSYVTGGAACRSSSELSAFGFLLHYGVSLDGLYHQMNFGWKDLSHRGWQGPGWIDGNRTANRSAVANSPELVNEALRRWRLHTPDDAPRIVVLGSQAWDLMRYLEHFNTTLAPAAWADEYGANLTSLAVRLASQLRLEPTEARRTPDRLILETSFHAGEDRIPRALSTLASECMRRVAHELEEQHGIPVLLLDNAAMQAKIEAQGMTVLSGDRLHATLAARRHSWDALRTLLIESGDLVSRAEGPRCLARDSDDSEGGALVVDGAVLAASRQCEWHPLPLEVFALHEERAAPLQRLSDASKQSDLFECESAELMSNIRSGRTTKRDIELVVLQYIEDISWTDPFDPIRTVYVKGFPSPSSRTALIDTPSTAIHLPNVGREQQSMLLHIVNNYDTLAARTIFFHASLPSCGYFMFGSHHLMSNVSALDYFTQPLYHKTTNGPQLFMPLTIKVTGNRKLWALRSSFANLPPPLHHLRRAERPVSLHPRKADDWTTIGDEWLGWEFFPFEQFCRTHHDNERLKRNVTVPYITFEEFFMRVFGRAPPAVMYAAQGAQFAASADAIRHTDKETYQWMLDRINAGNEEIVYYLEMVWYYLLGGSLDDPHIAADAAGVPKEFRDEPLKAPPILSHRGKAHRKLLVFPRRKLQDPCANVPSHCSEMCTPFSYCVTGTPDANCNNAPTYCSGECSQYASCGGGGGPGGPSPHSYSYDHPETYSYSYSYDEDGGGGGTLGGGRGGGGGGGSGGGPPEIDAPYMIRMGLVVSGTVEDYTESVLTSIKSSVAASAGVPVDRVIAMVEAGSVVLMIAILTDDIQTGHQISAALAPSFTDSTAASAFFGGVVTVEQIQRPPALEATDDEETIATPPPYSHPSPPAPPQIPPPSPPPAPPGAPPSPPSPPQPPGAPPLPPVAPPCVDDDTWSFIPSHIPGWEATPVTCALLARQSIGYSSCDPTGQIEGMLGTNAFLSICRVACGTCGVVFSPPPDPPPLPLPPPPPLPPTSPPSPPTPPAQPPPPQPPLAPGYILVTNTSQLLHLVLEAQKIAMALVQSSSGGWTNQFVPPSPPPLHPSSDPNSPFPPPPSPPPPSPSPSPPPLLPPSGRQDLMPFSTGPAAELNIHLEPGTYSLRGFQPAPFRQIRNMWPVATQNMDTYDGLYVPILINGFTLRLTSHGTGAVIDAEGLSRHFEIFDGEYTFPVQNLDGSWTTEAVRRGGTLVLDNVHLINGAADMRQPTMGTTAGGYSARLTPPNRAVEMGDTLTQEQGTYGGGCVLVLKGALTVRNSRMTGCSATNDHIRVLSDAAMSDPYGELNFASRGPYNPYDHRSYMDVVPTYDHPRGGAIDVIGSDSSVTLQNVQFSSITLHATLWNTTGIEIMTSSYLVPPSSARYNFGAWGSRGGVINMREGTSLVMNDTVINCRHVGTQIARPTFDDLDAIKGGAIAIDTAVAQLSNVVINGCRSAFGGAIYSVNNRGSVHSAAISLASTTLADNAAQCHFENADHPSRGGWGSCVAGGTGGCLHVSDTTVQITSGSSLDQCKAYESYGGAIYSSISAITLSGSNVTGARAFGGGGGGLMATVSDDGKGALAASIGGSLTIKDVHLADNKADEAGSLYYFMGDAASSFFGRRRLQSEGVDAFGRQLQSAFNTFPGTTVDATDMAIDHSCTSSDVRQASLISEGSRQQASVANYRINMMRGLQMSISGPCDGATLNSSLGDLVTVSGISGGSTCAAGESCDDLLRTSSDGAGTTSMCASGATCTCVPVIAGFSAAAPSCACPGATNVATVEGMSPDVVPYDGTPVGCETRVNIASMLYTSNVIQLDMLKEASAPFIAVNATVTIGGTAQQDLIAWHVPNTTSQPSWLQVTTPNGTVAKETAEGIAFDVSLVVRTQNLRENGQTIPTYYYQLPVYVGLENNFEPREASIPVRLDVTVKPLMSACTVERWNADQNPEAIDNPSLPAQAVMDTPFQFMFVSRDCDGLELNHVINGWYVNTTYLNPDTDEIIPNYADDAMSVQFQWLGDGRDCSGLEACTGAYIVSITSSTRGYFALEVKAPSNEAAVENATATTTTVYLNVGCPPGTEQIPVSEDGTGGCACSPGSMPDPKDLSQTTTCVPCPAGFYKSIAGSDACTQCFTIDNPPAVWPGRPGARSREECSCPTGFYRSFNTSAVRGSDDWYALSTASCISCDSFEGGVNCTYPGITTEDLPLNPRFWRTSSWSVDVRACLGQGNACLGGANQSAPAECACFGEGYPCPRPTNGSICALELSTCAEGHAGSTVSSVVWLLPGGRQHVRLVRRQLPQRQLVAARDRARCDCCDLFHRDAASQERQHLRRPACEEQPGPPPRVATAPRACVKASGSHVA